MSRRAIATFGAVAVARWLADGAPPQAPPVLAAARAPGTPVGSAPPIGPSQGALWVQPPNHGGAGRLAPDFYEMFTTRTDDWADARRFIAVWVLRMTSLLGDDPEVSDAFLGEAFLTRLNAWGIPLAVNVTGATLADCGDRPDRMINEAETIQRLIDLGARVSYLSLQSPLSKVGGQACPGYGRETGYDARIAGIVNYVASMTERFPGIKIGLVDAMTAKGWAYRDIYRALNAALAAAGLRLAFIHLDFPMESAAPGWTNVREVEDFVRGELGIPVGLIYVSRTGGETSNVAFRDNVLAGYRAFRAAGGRPDNLVLTSWYSYPATSLPEDDQANAPFMNLVLDFARLGGVVPRAAATTVVPAG